MIGDDILGVGIDPTEGELLPCVVACLLDGIVMEASIVAVIMEVLDSMFCRMLLEGKLGSECFVGLVVELEVAELEAAIVVNEAAIVVNKDSGALIRTLLGKFAFKLYINFYFP